jgi:hypothetical protein
MIRDRWACPSGALTGGLRYTYTICVPACRAKFFCGTAEFGNAFRANPADPGRREVPTVSRPSGELAMSSGAAAGAAAAAAAAQQLREEEEEMTKYSDAELQASWEFKILRSNHRGLQEDRRPAQGLRGRGPGRLGSVGEIRQLATTVQAAFERPRERFDIDRI